MPELQVSIKKGGPDSIKITPPPRSYHGASALGISECNKANHNATGTENPSSQIWNLGRISTYPVDPFCSTLMRNTLLKVSIPSTEDSLK
jgi:hypothetical protein